MIDLWYRGIIRIIRIDLFYMLQNIILGMILVVLVIILGIIIYHCFFRSPGGRGDIIVEEGKSGENIDLEQEGKVCGDVMVEGGEFDKDRQKAIEDLRLFALEKMEKERNNKVKGSPGEIRVNGQGTGPVTSGKEYIPYNLNERDKAILRAFNEK